MSNQAEDYKALWESAKAKIDQLQNAQNRIKLKNDSIFEFAGDSIFIIDFIDYVVVDANGHAARRLGYTHDELIGMSMSDIEINVANDNTLKLAWESEYSGTQVYECMHRHKDGYLIPVEVVSNIIEVNGRGAILSFVRNIEVRKLLQMRELELELEKERLNLLTSFIQNAGHEFRTPMTKISTNAYLMAKSDDPQKRQERNDLVQDEIRHMTKLVDMLLLMTKLESSQSVDWQSFDIIVLLSTLLNEYRDTYGEMPTLIREGMPDEVHFQGNIENIEKALRQILDNAYHFTPQDSRITVSVTLSNYEISIAICDKGIGISEEALPHIFEAFWRQDESHSTPGLGIGLTIAQKIIKRHSGEIKVTSILGEGTNVYLSLPLTPS